jgi:EAL domain-containing protein (putative c-di-GMP-specific phosphodiesterase class I)
VKFVSDAGLHPAQLTLEITENGIIHNVEEAERIVDGIRRTGVRVALDDFGTGYSSFDILRRVKLDVLKIDKAGDRVITSSLLSISRSLGLLSCRARDSNWARAIISMSPFPRTSCPDCGKPETNSQD